MDPPADAQTAVATRGRAWSFLVGGDLAYRALAAGFWLALARTLDAPSLGDVALATALSVPALVILDGGLAEYLVREARPEHGGRLPRALRPALRRRAAFMFVLPAAVAAGTAAFGASPDRAWIGLLVGASASFEGAAIGWLAAPRASGHMRPYATFRAVYGAAALAAVATLWAVGELSGLTAAAATATGAAVAAALAARHRPPGGRWVERPVEEPAARRRFFHVTVLTSAFLSADSLVLAVMLGSAALAPYALATKIVATLRVLPVATMRVSLSWTAHRGGRDARDEVRTATRLGFALAFAGVAAGPWVAEILFGSTYADEMATPLRILSLTMIPVALKSPLSGRHLAAGDTALVLRSVAYSFCVVVVALPLGTALADATGTAIAFVLAELAGTAPFIRRRRDDGWALRDAVPGGELPRIWRARRGVRA